MYFFDLEDYAGTTREGFNADVKSGKGGNGINYCGRPLHFQAVIDMRTTANATADAHQLYVYRWFSATTINIGNSTNTLAREIFYNELQPNWLQYRIDWTKYANQSMFTEKVWESRCIDNKTDATFTCTSYLDAYKYYVNTNSISTGTTVYPIYSADPITNIGVLGSFTIVHPEFNDWNDSYYYNQNNSLRNYMGSLKRLMKAIDNDDFGEFNP